MRHGKKTSQRFKFEEAKMKQLRKTLLTVLCALFVLSLTISIVACNDTNICNISVQYDRTRGSITLSDPANDKGYVVNEQVTATVSAFNHYTVASFKVNGTETELTDNTYTFTVKRDTTIAADFVGEEVAFTVNYQPNYGNVTWATPDDGIYRYGDTVVLTVTPATGMAVSSVKANGTAIVPDNGTYSIKLAGNTTVAVTFIGQSQIPTMSLSTLASLQGSILFEGGYDYDDSIDAYDMHHDVTTLFDTKANAIWNRESMQGYILYEYLYINQDGKLVLVEHTADNTIKYTNSDVDFADFDNPFIDLTVDDFIWATDGVWSLRADLTRKTAVAITGWNESIASFLLFENDGVIDSISITTQFIGEDGDGYRSYYTFEVKQHGTAAVPAAWLAPYEETAAHAELKTALEAAANAKSYTIAIHTEEEGWEDLDYHMFVTEDVIYENLEGWENGYRAMAGLVYPFDYDPQTGEGFYYDPLDVNSLANLRATFRGFAPALLEHMGNGVYALNSHDYALAGDIAWAFANGADQQRYYGYATAFKITIENGMLKQVQFYYNYYGYIAETVTLTYSDWNQTTVDIDFTEFEMKSVFDSFEGTYSDNAGNTVTIENGKITINGTRMDIEGFDTKEFYFYGTWNDMTVYVWKLSMRQLMVYDEDETFSWMLKLVGTFDPVEIPEELRGVWEDTEVDAELIIQTYAVILNGTALEVLSYSDAEGIVCVLGDVTYIFLPDKEKLYGIIYEDGVGVITYIFTYKGESDAIEIPAEWVGEYEGTQDGVTYHISITAARIVVTMGKDSYTAVIIDYDSYEGFTITLDGDIFFIAEGYGNGNGPKQNIGLMTEDFHTLNVMLKRVTGAGSTDPEPAGDIPQKYVGTFTGTVDDSEWIIIITKSDVAVSIDGTAQNILRVEYDDIYKEICFYMNGTWYYIGDASMNDPISTISLTKDGDYAFFKTLRRTSGSTTPEPNPDTPEFTFDSDYIGTWVSLDGELTIVIGQHSITIDGETITEISGNGGYIGYELVWKNSNYELYLEGVMLVLMDSASFDCTNFLPEGFTSISVTFDQTYIGIWKTEDGQHTLVISEHSATLDGVPIHIVADNGIYGYSVVANGTLYSLYLDDYTYDNALVLSDINYVETAFYLQSTTTPA